MSEFSIIVDSACDIFPELAERFELNIVPLTVRLDGKEYLDCRGEGGISPDVLSEKLKRCSEIKTSSPSVELFAETMEKPLAEGKDVLYIGFSSTLSGTYNAGRIAADMLSARYPERSILTVDSYSASLGYGMLVWLAALEREKGCSVSEAAAFAESMKLRINHWFTLSDLAFLRRGGRLSAAAATVGIVLHIKPVMHMDADGHLTPVTKVRGRNASLKTIAEKVREHAVNPEEQTVFICQCGCAEEAEKVAEMIKAEARVKDVLIGPIGPVISAHTGPGTMGIFFVGESR